jgi:Transposase zinc-binding domain
MPSPVAAPRHWAVTAIGAPAAGHQAISFNSCRNRHCPKCQGNARAKWLAARSAELLPVPYFHVVFTLPHELSALVLQNKRLLYDLLYRTSAATMLEIRSTLEPTSDS